MSYDFLTQLSEFYPRGSNKETLFTSDDFYHRLIEAEKFAYSLRSRLGDPKFVKEAGELAEKMTKKEFVEAIANKIEDEALSEKEYGKAVAQVSLLK